MLFLNF